MIQITFRPPTVVFHHLPLLAWYNPRPVQARNFHCRFWGGEQHIAGAGGRGQHYAELQGVPQAGEDCKFIKSYKVSFSIPRSLGCDTLVQHQQDQECPTYWQWLTPPILVIRGSSHPSAIPTTRGLRWRTCRRRILVFMFVRYPRIRLWAFTQ